MTIEVEPDVEQKGWRGKETLFWVTIRNQIDQISIADNKANMIISINTIIISLVVALLGATGFSTSYLNGSQIYIPFSILLIASTLSAIFSILAARPRFRNVPPNFKTSSLLYFGNFKHMALTEYIAEMEELISSKKAIYRNLIIDIYNYGKILDNKYKMLSVSYTIFLLGIILTVLSYFTMFIINLYFLKPKTKCPRLLITYKAEDYYVKQ